MDKKQTLLITTIILIVISLLAFFIIKNGKIIKTKKADVAEVVYLPVKTYSEIKNIKETYTSPISLSNNVNIDAKQLTTESFIIPENINIYNFTEINNDEKRELIKKISATTGLQILNGKARLGTQNIYIDPKKNSISYTNEIKTKDTFPQTFNDETYLPKAKEASLSMGINLDNYEYTTFAYKKAYGYDLVTVNQPQIATSIQYTFERKIDGYKTYSTQNNIPKSVNVWLDTSGNLIKFQAITFGHIIDVNTTVKTKTLEQIKESILAGNVKGVNGDITTMLEPLAFVNIKNAEIFYYTAGEKAIPLVKLKCSVVTTNGRKGNATFVTDLIDLDKLDVLN